MAKTPDESLKRRSLADDVSAAIVRLIHNEGIAVGEKLPTITELSERLRVSRTIVREAVDRLCSQGTLRRTTSRQWIVSTGSQTNGKVQLPQDEKITHRSLADCAADAVLEHIISTEMAEGDPLPGSAELSKQYGVSIVVIREALASLAARGILQRRQGREPVVAMPGSRIISSIIRVRALLESIEHEEFQSCRKSLEEQSARLAAASDVDPEFKAELLHPAIDALRAAKGQDDYNDADQRFHLALAKLSGNRAILLMLEALNDLVRDNMQLTYERVTGRDGDLGVELSLAHHSCIADAVIAGDVDKAGEAMVNHFYFAEDR